MDIRTFFGKNAVPLPPKKAHLYETRRKYQETHKEQIRLKRRENYLLHRDEIRANYQANASHHAEKAKQYRNSIREKLKAYELLIAK